MKTIDEARAQPRLQRVPPHDPTLEAHLLGAAMLNQATAEIVASLPPEVFYKPSHGHIADAVGELFRRHQATDAGTVGAHLAQLGLLDTAGGYPGLTQLTIDTPVSSPASTAGWAETIRAMANKRRQLSLAGEIIEAVYRGAPTTGLASQLEQEADLLEQLHINSWEPVNLAQTLAGDTPETVPTILARTDQTTLIYPGKIHTINAEPESGKSWVALLACLQEMRIGNHALYIDEEDSASGITSRLLALGASVEEILERFHYIRPDDPLDPSATARVVAVIDTFHPTIAVIDGVTEAIVSMGGSIKDNDDIARFLAALPRPIARQGTAVLLLDHVVKNKDERGRWGIGGQHKLAGVDGATYTLEKITPFAPGIPGTSRMIVSKDRHGQIRAHCATVGITQIAGIVHFQSQGDGTIDVDIRPDTDHPGGVAWSGPTHCQDAILELLAGMPGEEISQAQLVDRLRARGNSYRKQTVIVAAEQLVDAGRLQVRNGPRNARMYRHEETSDEQTF